MICFSKVLFLRLKAQGNPTATALLYIMFGSNPRPTPAAPAANETQHTNGNGHGHAAPNRLSSDVCIKGDVSFQSELAIDGEVVGSITSEGKLIIDTHGKVTGDIQVGSVDIHGSVNGDVLASERCALEAGSSLQGDIEAPRLAVDESASFIGNAKIAANRG
jgi:cytoskeletal protein CcmA (bactofilin family)